MEDYFVFYSWASLLFKKIILIFLFIILLLLQLHMASGWQFKVKPEFHPLLQYQNHYCTYVIMVAHATNTNEGGVRPQPF